VYDALYLFVKVKESKKQIVEQGEEKTTSYATQARITNKNNHINIYARTHIFIAINA
jgi:hypothetical protein